MKVLQIAGTLYSKEINYVHYRLDIEVSTAYTRTHIHIDIGDRFVGCI